MRAFPDSSWSDGSKVPMPADRVAAQPWLIAGRLLFAPFPPRDGGLTARQAEAIEAMGMRLQRDRRAGLLPDSTAFWFGPIDGQTTSLTANQARSRVKVLQHVVVDLGLLEAMGRAIPLTLLQPKVSGYETADPSVATRKNVRFTAWSARKAGMIQRAKVPSG
jgi:hypothetical protein